MLHVWYIYLHLGDFVRVSKYSSTMEHMGEGNHVFRWQTAGFTITHGPYGFDPTFDLLMGGGDGEVGEGSSDS